MTTGTPIDVEELRTLFLFEGMTPEQLAEVAASCEVRTYPAGSTVYRAGEPSVALWVLLDGTLRLVRHADGDEVVVNETDYRGSYAGAVRAFATSAGAAAYPTSLHAVTDCRFLRFPADAFAAFVQKWFPMAVHLFDGLYLGIRTTEATVRQREHLAQLGTLSANLAHELNNPASAAQRSAASLFGELREYGEQKYRLGNLCLTEQEIAAYRAWVQNARARMSAFSGHSQGPQSPLATTDREEALVRWLESHNVPNSWTIAPALSETNMPIDLLDELAAITRPEVLPVAVATVAGSLRVERMAETVVDSTVRIFDLISAIKDYSYMDQAPIQDVDLAQSLENTLVMFNSRLKNVTVELDFDPELPPVSAYGSELNQVWTELIDNALESMNDMGTLRLITHLNGSMALVEVWDDGPGIDPSIRSRIFEPFFTTKAPGRGLGLGLDAVQRIVNKHSGFVTVESKPGATCFQVRLPLDRAQAY